MGDLATLFASALTEANKLLGKDGDLPKPRLDIIRACDELEKAGHAFLKKQDDVSDSIDTLKGAAAKLTNATKSYENMVDKDSFGLNPSDPKAKKTIAAVTKVLGETLSALDGLAGAYFDMGDKMDKAIDGLKRPKY